MWLEGNIGERVEKANEKVSNAEIMEGQLSLFLFLVFLVLLILFILLVFLILIISHELPLL